MLISIDRFFSKVQGISPFKPDTNSTELDDYEIVDEVIFNYQEPIFEVSTRATTALKFQEKVHVICYRDSQRLLLIPNTCII